ncbi:MAG: class I SAM-dependent methyltransferase [Haloarculaceae archaeon]
MDRFQHTRQPDWDWWGRLWPTPGASLRQLGIEAGQSLLEVGAGNGYFALPAARITHPAPVYGLDVDDSLLDELAALARLQGIENVVSVHGDARSLTDHLPTTVDVVLVANTFHGVEERAAFVREAFDALVPGGAFVVVNWNAEPRERTTVAGEPRGPPTDSRLSPGETRDAVEGAAGFALDRQVELPPYHYALTFEA